MLATVEKFEQREWLTFDNEQQQIFAVLHRPIYTAKPPLVIVMHGFASSKHGTNRCYVYLAEELARAGIATLRFDFRGAGDSEGDLSKLSFDDLISDARRVFDSLDSIEGVDADRVGVFGASMGGAIAVLSSAQSQLTKAMALWAPVASGQLWYRDFIANNPALAKADPKKTLATYRGLQLNPHFMEQFGQMSAATTLGTLEDIPLLHMQGEGDTEVTQAHQEAYRQTCKRGEFVTYPDAEHKLGCSPVLPEVTAQTVRWFKKHL